MTPLIVTPVMRTRISASCAATATTKTYGTRCHIIFATLCTAVAMAQNTNGSATCAARMLRGGTDDRVLGVFCCGLMPTTVATIMSNETLELKLSELFDGRHLEEIIPALVTTLAFAIVTECDTKLKRLKLYEIVTQRLLDEILEMRLPDNDVH